MFPGFFPSQFSEDRQSSFKQYEMVKQALKDRRDAIEGDEQKAEKLVEKLMEGRDDLATVLNKVFGETFEENTVFSDTELSAFMNELKKDRKGNSSSTSSIIDDVKSAVTFLLDEVRQGPAARIPLHFDPRLKAGDTVCQTGELLNSDCVALEVKKKTL